MCAMVGLWRSEGKLREKAFSLHYVGSGDQIPVDRCGSKHTMLAIFQLDTSYSHLRTSTEKKAPIGLVYRQTCRALSWLIIDVEGPQLTGSFLGGWYSVVQESKLSKLGGTRQHSKQCFSVVSTSVPALTSLIMDVQDDINPFPSKSLLVISLSQQ